MCIARSSWDSFNWKAYTVYNLTVYKTRIQPTHPNGSRSGPVCHSSWGTCGIPGRYPAVFVRGKQMGPRRVPANFRIIKNYKHQPVSVRVYRAVSLSLLGPACIPLIGLYYIGVTAMLSDVKLY